MARHAFLSTFLGGFFYKEGGWVAFRLSLLPLPLSFFSPLPSHLCSSAAWLKQDATAEY